MELEGDPNFKKYIMMYKIKIPLANIRQKMKDEGLFEPELFNVIYMCIIL